MIFRGPSVKIIYQINQQINVQNLALEVFVQGPKDIIWDPECIYLLASAKLLYFWKKKKLFPFKKPYSEFYMILKNENSHSLPVIHSSKKSSK